LGSPGGFYQEGVYADEGAGVGIYGDLTEGGLDSMLQAPSMLVGDDEEDEDEQEAVVRTDLSVKIVGARGLMPAAGNTDPSGLCRACVLLAMGPVEMKSVIAAPSNEPTWNELTLLSWDGFSVLQVQVADCGGADGRVEVLGEAYLELEPLDLQTGRTVSQTISLSGTTILVDLEVTMNY